ncbi:MAG: hypothetical protein KGL34_03770 [Gammaproteobacteria bacterium]|nr:hypothetical protein [Gammaproteobacteria bacterium]
MQTDRPTDLQERSRALFEDSVAAVDMRVRSRLTRARHAALEAASRPAPRLPIPTRRTLAAAVTLAGALAIAVWLGWPAGSPAPGPLDGRAPVEDLDLVASSEPGSGDALDMMREDADFYAWAAAQASPAQPTADSAG